MTGLKAQAAAPSRSSPAADSAVAPAATASQSAATPQFDLADRSKTPATKAAPTSRVPDKTVPIAAGGVLALLAIGGAALAINRRRNEDEEEWPEDSSIVPEPAGQDASEDYLTYNSAAEEQPAIIAPPVSAFRWGNARESQADTDEHRLIVQDDREPGETWVQRAYCGPSALNPSVSLKTRLKRAAFFDKRERDASAGLAEPIDPTAGLPGRMVEENEHNALV